MTTNKAASIGKKYFLAAAGGGGKSTLAMLMTSTAIFRKVEIDIFDVEPANPTLRRYFKAMPAENALEDDRPEAVVPFLENRVFATSRPAIVDLGANMEGHVLRWINDRGAAVAEDIRFIVPISKRDGITAATRIAYNSGAASILIVHNEAGGLDAEAAMADPAFARLAEEVVHFARLPQLGPTMADVHRTSTPPHLMMAGKNRFEAQGALTMLRVVDETFSHHPDFRPW
ncbi:hypothetical protein [Bosea sp. (in: a-proteobacteria)]|uniref:hypothetical protein n=1 Tax=Bosea sp. (in: a-proteobacteria) TaxID=1871050 RepID=UPI001ACE7C32|nr:hypothetical protein [Bosea sp. (in: a-proteobacteria)]MBN9438470.1 hypothetical protein [Bosea sp. (in: a-proteobacteria)]